METRFEVISAVIAFALIGWTGAGFAQGESSEDSSSEESASAGAAKFQVLEAKSAGGGIEEREPVDVSSSFSKGDRVTVWMAVRNPESPKNVKLVWKAGEIEVASMDLEIGNSWRWRTWGHIKVQKTGDWTAEIKGPDGETLETVEFSVSES